MPFSNVLYVAFCFKFLCNFRSFLHAFTMTMRKWNCIVVVVVVSFYCESWFENANLGLCVLNKDQFSNKHYFVWLYNKSTKHTRNEYVMMYHEFL